MNVYRPRVRAIAKPVSLDELPERVVIVDTETTGLQRTARLVEVAAVLIERGKVIETWSTLVDPQMRIPWEVTRIHQITDAMVRGAPDARHAIDALRERVQDTPVVMHNASFDLRILAQESLRLGIDPPMSRALCTMKLARETFVGLASYRLSYLAYTLALVQTVSHRAQADAMVTAQLYERIVRTKREAQPGYVAG
ncbi:MAG: 3'-5' exonuclease [Deltaproteobacteria bacterium]|nr:3'-5' exonuclease [Deltaproteobacteria bacterium]